METRAIIEKHRDWNQSGMNSQVTAPPLKNIKRRMSPRTLFWILVAVIAVFAVIFIWPSWQHSETHSFDIGSDDHTIVFDADGKGGSGIYALDLTTGKIKLVIDTDLGEFNPTLSPDMKTVCFSGSRDAIKGAHLYICSLDGTRFRQLTKGAGVFDRAPCFTPDGKQIVFSRAGLLRDRSMGGKSWNSWDIWVLDLKSGKTKQITHGQYYSVGDPKVMSDGKSVIFTDHIYNQQKSTDDISVVSLDGFKPPKHVTQEGDYTQFDVVKTNGDILFISMRNSEKRTGGGLFEYEIWRMQKDGSKQTEVTQLRSFLSHVRSFSTGAEALCFDDPSRGNNEQLLRVDLKTGKATKVAGPDLFQDPLNWKPER